MHKPYVYYHRTDKTRGTIVAVSPRELTDADTPPDTEKFVISKPELVMFQKALVAISNWQVLIDPRTNQCQLVKKHDAARYENADVLVEVLAHPDPDVQIEYYPDRILVMPGPTWIPIEKNSLPMDFYLTRKGDPNVLLAQDRIDPKELTKPLGLFTNLKPLPVWGEFSILVPGGFRYGVRCAQD